VIGGMLLFGAFLAIAQVGVGFIPVKKPKPKRWCINQPPNGSRFSTD